MFLNQLTNISGRKLLTFPTRFVKDTKKTIQYIKIYEIIKKIVTVENSYTIYRL